jgi:hypothetical protein
MDLCLFESMVVKGSGWRGLRSGRCRLVARVPQDRMLSRSDAWNGSGGKADFGEQLIYDWGRTIYESFVFPCFCF